MKPIEQMSINECLWVICNPMEVSPQYTSTEILKQIAERIHELTRWIPVEERLPTEEEFPNNAYFWVYIHGVETARFRRGKIHVWDDEAFNAGWSEYNKSDYRTAFTHWRRIDKPEGV